MAHTDRQDGASPSLLLDMPSGEHLLYLFLDTVPAVLCLLINTLSEVNFMIYDWLYDGEQCVHVYQTKKAKKCCMRCNWSLVHIGLLQLGKAMVSLDGISLEGGYGKSLTRPIGRRVWRA